MLRGEYIIIAGVCSTAIVFSTRPLKNSFKMLQDNDDDLSSSIIPEFDCTLKKTRAGSGQSHSSATEIAVYVSVVEMVCCMHSNAL